MAKGEQVTEVVSEDTRQVAMVEEALGRLEQVTLGELWGEQNSWLAGVVLLAFLVLLPPFMPGRHKRESACLSFHHDILYCAQTYVRVQVLSTACIRVQRGEKEKHQLAWLRQKPQGVLSQHGMAQQAKHGGEGGEEEEQEEGEEWEQVYQSAELVNPCLLASTLESWAPWVARKCSILPWSWCRLRKSANMLSCEEIFRIAGSNLYLQTLKVYSRYSCAISGSLGRPWVSTSQTESLSQ